MQEISHEAKLDAFTTLMEVKKSAQNCMRKNGCNFGYDYCATSKCGPCQVMPQNSYKGGACTPLSVDVDQELDVVNSMNKAELLDIATKVMDNTVAAGPTHSYAKQGSFAAASWVDPNAPKKIDDDTYDDDQPTLLSASVTDVDFEKQVATLLGTEFSPDANPAYVTYHSYSENDSTNTLMCSDQSPGLQKTWGYFDISAMYPYVGACSMNREWGDAPMCGACVKITDTATGNSVHITCVDGCGDPSNFDLARPAFEELFGQDGIAAGNGSAEWEVESDWTKCEGNLGPF